MAAGDNHNQQRDGADSEPERAVGVAEHHIVAEHAPDHQGRAERQRQRRLPAKAAHRFARAALLPVAPLLFILHRLSVVARRVDRLDQLLRRGVAHHQRAAFAKVDARLGHARHFFQRLLYPADAAGAAHAFDKQKLRIFMLLCRLGFRHRCQRLRRRL